MNLNLKTQSLKPLFFSLSLLVLSHCASPVTTPVTNPDMPSETVETTSPSPAATVDATAPSDAEPTDAELKQLASEYQQTLVAIKAALTPSSIHGTQVRTFLNPEALTAYQAKNYPYAAGTVSIKESHGAEAESINRLYVMKKVPGYDPEHGDWFYGVMSTEGVPSQKGKVQFCISCHQGAQDKDYLFGFED